ncbi:ABC transporter substrate-binding protein [Actinomadura fulvescens]|uniref:ABC transporter substrate-binding protein n=1 Tax=Actinomadura fulvescens TaxID=46160 RepID=A0ABP6C224_9ACTN
MRLIRVLAPVLASVVALTSCGGDGDDSKGSGPHGLERPDLTVGVLPIADSAAVMLARSKGFFRAEGLNVKVEIIQGGATATPKLLSGLLDATLTNYVSLFIARERGNDLQIVADAAASRPGLFTIMVTKDSPVRAPADLKGKVVAVNTLKNIGELASLATLKNAGVEAKDVRFVEYPLPNMAPALEKRAVEAAWMTEPFITGGKNKLGLRSIADTMTGPMADFPIAGWVVTRRFADKNPKTVAAFRRAVVKAQALLAADRAELEAVLPTYTSIDAATAKAVTVPTFPTKLDPARIQRVPDVMRQYGYLTGKADAAAAIVAP